MMMNLLESAISLKYLYPLWRIGWLERAFFLLCRSLDKPRQKIFDTDIVGHDVSYYQGVIDFQRMKATGADFVIIRCGYRTIKDSMFNVYMEDAEGVLPRNVYHFYDPAHPPLAQAQSIIDTLRGYSVKRIWLDFEFEWSGNYSAPNHWLTYRNALNAAGYETGIYTRKTWWDSRVGSFAAEFARDPVWAAQYSSALTLIPAGWSKAMIWQSGSPTYDAGQTSPRIDYNLWNTDFDFAAEWGTPNNGGTNMKGVMLGYTVNIRNAAGSAIGVLRVGDVVYGEVRSNRIYYDKVYRADKTIMSFVGCSSVVSDDTRTPPLYYMTLTNESEPVTPPPPPPPVITLPVLPVVLTLGDDVTYAKQTVTINLQPLK